MAVQNLHRGRIKPLELTGQFSVFPKFLLPPPPKGNLFQSMPRKIKQSRSVLAPIAQAFVQKMTGADERFRRRVLFVAFTAVIGIFIYSLTNETYGVMRIMRLRAEAKSLGVSNLALSAEVIDAERVRDLLLSDKAYIEKIARTKYLMAYPNEQVFRYRGR
jgi:cell division protein FtsB